MATRLGMRSFTAGSGAVLASAMGLGAFLGCGARGVAPAPCGWLLCGR
jgi:hypothetical protein